MNAVTKSFTDALHHPSVRLTQHLRIWIGKEALDHDVLDFKVLGGFCKDYVVDVTVTSPRLDIDGKDYVGRRAGLHVDERAAVPSGSWTTPVDHAAATFNGIATRGKRIRTSRDEAAYKVRIEPRFAALGKRIVHSDVLDDVTFEEMVRKKLVEGKNFDAFDVEFHLEGPQEKMQQIVMYEEYSAGENLIATARDMDVSIAKRLRMAAGELISLCAHKLGINLVAAKGKLTASALTDGMDLFAQKRLRIASESADVQVAAKSKITLNSGGASLVIENGNMTFHCPGAFTIKAGSFTFVGPDNVPAVLPVLPKSDLKLNERYSHTN
ncbi:phage late control D family protein [Paraburkholderia guartelaensis]|uniref:phage late control D family protein n=1 Tax=Paraburkholderia guartelaensis TaxID=2546446 RepID=UPI002AB7B70B|nr:DUF2345 domain-containing protein [Paraburkholderia guartelaensis]